MDIKSKYNNLTNFDMHLKILSFLSYLKDLELITEKEKEKFSGHIQGYLMKDTEAKEMLEEFTTILLKKVENRG